MKYLVIKGWLGFGDRLESLKMGIAFAQQHKLKVYVDWSDEMWTHGTENFYTYFKLINIDQIASLDEIPEDATYYPEFWKGNIKTPYSYGLITNGKQIDAGHLIKDFGADVVVLGCGMRTLFANSNFFANVFRINDQRILQKIRERKARYPIAQSWGIHIRGTDRIKRGYRSMSVQALCSLITCQGALNGVKMTVVSDDKENLQIFRNYYPDAFVASELSIQQDSIKGNHNLGKDALKFSKDIITVDLLTDFFTLALCDRVYTTVKDSRFYKEAVRLHPVINTILS